MYGCLVPVSHMIKLYVGVRDILGACRSSIRLHRSIVSSSCERRCASCANFGPFVFVLVINLT
jgi:hypothetical protein